MLRLLSANPSLGKYHKKLLIGVPGEVVRALVVSDLLSDSPAVGETAARSFIQLAIASDDSEGTGISTRENQTHLVGTKNEIHGSLGDASWESPVLVASCERVRSGAKVVKTCSLLYFCLWRAGR